MSTWFHGSGVIKNSSPAGFWIAWLFVPLLTFHLLAAESTQGLTTCFFQWNSCRVDEGCGLRLQSSTVFGVEVYFFFLNLRFITVNQPSGGKKPVKVLILWQDRHTEVKTLPGLHWWGCFLSLHFIYSKTADLH